MGITLVITDKIIIIERVNVDANVIRCFDRQACTTNQTCRKTLVFRCKRAVFIKIVEIIVGDGGRNAFAFHIRL